MSRPLPRYTEATVKADPLELALAQRQAKEDHARQMVAAGRTPDADPQDLRGIPCIARGVGGATRGSSPHLVDYDRARQRTQSLMDNQGAAQVVRLTPLL